jgi:tetratricopeptide (TPR) repeat protein
MARVPVLAGDAGQELLDRAMRQAEAGNEEGTSPLDRARVITEQARHLITRGEPAQAEQALQQAHQQAHQLFTTAGAEDEAATVMGIIADIAYDRGELDEALRIRREIELPALERLGDTRSAAVTWGQIADIAYRRGELDEALRIQREIELPALERLGDTRSAAVTWGQIADIAYQSGELDEAAELQHKRLEVNKQLGDLDGIAAATWDLAQIDLTREDYESAFPRTAPADPATGTPSGPGRTLRRSPAGDHSTGAPAADDPAAKAPAASTPHH